MNEGGSVEGLGTSEGQRKSAHALGAKISLGKVHIFGNRGRSTGGPGTQDIGLPHQKAILIALVGTTEGALVRWKQTIDLPLGNNIFFRNRGGSAGGLGTQSFRK